MAKKQFSINFDYRCPFARNANENVVAALNEGADYEVSFKGFSLNQAHVSDGDISVFDNPSEKENLLAVAAGIVVRDKFPEYFYKTHIELFAARHDHGGDLRDEGVIASALKRGGVDEQAVLKELDDGWPFEVFRGEHESSVSKYQVFGVPTFVVGDQAVFVRLMQRPGNDGKSAVKTIDNVLSLIETHGELNEFKHTSIPQ